MTARRLTNDDWGFESLCFVCEARNDAGLQLEFWADEDAGQVYTDLTLGREYSGAPSVVHGGVSLAILDEVQAWAVIALEHQWAVTAETTARFLRPLRLDSPYRAIGEIAGRDGDRVRTVGRIETAKGLVCIESTAVFQAIGEAQAIDLAGAPLGDTNRSYTTGSNVEGGSA